MPRHSATILAVIFAMMFSVLGWAQDGAGQGTPAAMQSNSTQATSTQPSITGTVAYRERIALPPNAAIEVKLQDASQQDAATKSVAESLFSPGGQQVPIPFRLTYTPSDINPAHTYQVRATISVDGKLMFSSTTAYPVLTNGAPSQVTILLQQVQAPATTASAGTNLHGTHWTLSELNGKPASPGQGEPAHLVFHKKGKMSGSTGCNTLAGSYIAEQGALQFTPAATTMKMCSAPVMEQEQAFLAALKATTKYKIDGNTLELMNGDQSLAKFQAESK